MKKFLLILVLLLLLVTPILGQSIFIGGFEQYDPDRKPVPITPLLRQYWREVEQCSGLTRNIDTMRFYIYPTLSDYVWVDDDEVIAWWEDRTITVVSTHANEAEVWKHEMLHALIGVPGHPVFFYTYKCKLPITYTGGK